VSVIIWDPLLAAEIRAKRACVPASQYDEVWEGVYVVPPAPNNEHQDLLSELSFIFRIGADRGAGDRVLPGCNVSDRAAGWTENYREPDLAVFLAGTAAVNHGTHWQGGPDLAVEIVSPGERSRDKLPFYAAVGTREVLVIDRDPWQLELYRLAAGAMQLVGTSTPAAPTPVASAVLPLTFALAAGTPRPVVEVRHTDGRTWTA
jgi:Uma2 family endonuclease